MQARINGRRAAPPRPTLLVGDLAACHAAFDRLQQRVLGLALAEQATDDEETSKSTVDGWRDLVPLCRALRETLTSLRELSHFTRKVYECAAEVCTRAGDYPEALKALQQLVHLIYPALALRLRLEEGGEEGGVGQQQERQLEQSERQRQAAPPGPGNGGRVVSPPPPPVWVDEEEDGGAEGLIGGIGAAAALDDAAVGAALQQRQFRRWPEVAAALVLYFACVQQAAADKMDTPSTLRRLPRMLLQTAEVRLALQLHAALAAGDYVALFRLLARAPLLVQQVVGAAAPREREAAVAVLAAGYRNVAAAAVCRALALETRGLLACLKLLADRGHLAAQRALSGLQQEDQPAAADLVFKG